MLVAPATHVATIETDLSALGTSPCAIALVGTD
jgi:hypothetical protein